MRGFESSPSRFTMKTDKHICAQTCLKAENSRSSLGSAYGSRPASEISRCCVIPPQIYARLRVTGENAIGQFARIAQSYAVRVSEIVRFSSLLPFEKIGHLTHLIQLPHLRYFSPLFVSLARSIVSCRTPPFYPGTYLCGLARAYRSLPSVRKPARNRVQPGVYRPTLFALSLGRHDKVSYLGRRRLTRQRKHLVHSDTGPDCGITQARFANLL